MDIREVWVFMTEQIKARYNKFLTNGITRAKTTRRRGAPITHDNTIYLMQLISHVWTTWVKYL